MNILFACIAQQHDLKLVLLAACICALGTFSAFALGREVLRSRQASGCLIWGTLGVTATASAIWATHFIAMLAYRPGLPFRFEAAPTILSFGVALTLVGAGAALIVARPDRFGRTLGGCVTGAAIGAMHYAGMSGFRVQGALRWDSATVVVSVLAGIALGGLSAAATTSRFRAIAWLAPVLLLLAVCSAHFIGMSAVTIDYDPGQAEPDGWFDVAILALVVGEMATLIVCFSLASVWLSIRGRRQLAAEEKRLHDLVDIAIEGLLICDGETIVGLNRSLERMLGADRHTIIGKAVHDLLPARAAASVPIGAEVDATLRIGTGGLVPVKLIAQEITIGTQRHRAIAVRDQRNRIETELYMNRLAREDALTGLGNRLTFAEELSAQLVSRRKGDNHFALLMLDLDRFKLVNDTLGHGVGDELLRRVAGRLRSAVSAGDLLARLGGDEFAVLARDAADAEAVQALAERLIDVIGRPYVINGQVVIVGASLGIALAPTDGGSPEGLARNADLALYRAKEEGRGTYRMFEEGMNARMQARRLLEAELRKAISRREFVVYYQPQIDVRTKTYTGAEALVRWYHPRRGLVSPAEFIPLAEEVGLIGAIGEFVLREACTEATHWPDSMTVAVNLSAVQLRDVHLVSTVARILADTGLAADRLELELTESALMHDEAQALSTLVALRGMGIHLSMDDFGTGYSSLSYLRRFPFNKIKIDQSFVRQLPDDGESAAIVRAVTMLGSTLGMTIVAEGVETAAQMAFTAAEGCDQAQGYLIGKPVHPSKLADAFAGVCALEPAA